MLDEKKPAVILIADDDEDYYFLAKEALEKLPFVKELHRVEDGMELMDYLLRQGKYQNSQNAPRPGLIFLDLNMPRKSGHEALKEIRANPELRQIPVIMLTISRDTKDVLLSYSLGANSFLTKPLLFDHMVRSFKVFKEYWYDTIQLPPS